MCKNSRCKKPPRALQTAHFSRTPVPSLATRAVLGLAPLALVPVLAIAQPILSQQLQLRPGDRPTLVRPVAAFLLGAPSPAGAEAAIRKAKDSKTKWTCPMHPHYIADEFGTCPICGMDLVKLNTGGLEPKATAGETRAIITIAPEVIQSIGVRIGKSEMLSFGRTVRSYGIVHANERLRTDITSRVEGWVEELHVTAVGDTVEVGTVLFKLYSPQLIISQSDFLRSKGAAALKVRALSQLRSFGVQPQALQQIEGAKSPLRLVPFFAARKGTIAKLMLKQGSYVKRGMLLAEIQDYSSVWLQVGVAEKDLAFIDKSTPAIVTFPNLPGRKVKARVDYIYPTIDAKTRTGQVRLVIDNSDGKVRPGSYADVEFQVGSKERLAIHSDAVLTNGDGKFVVISLGKGRFEPRAVKTGLVTGRWTEIKSGVKASEAIVLSGQFMLDSESALRESFRKLKRLQLPLSLLKLTKNEMAMIDHMVDAALYLHEALIDGYDVQPTFIDPAIAIRDLLWPRYKNTQLAYILDDARAALSDARNAKSESEVQAALSRLTASLRPWVISGAPDHYRKKKLALFQEKSGGRLWLQLSGRALNPYGRGPGRQLPWPEPKSSKVPAATAGKPGLKAAPAKSTAAAPDPDKG